ncbi:amino acid permease-domain-containing protein [Pseudomassariella vexata]|uniref:Amino acid permease-domain-containing protein n=1 Tax=Pseudomassariella vexata TaxID=1141098 RepID=A0A1Y2DZ30_9PEZI|nr:amino acid permease-domain-containing protein [Pseudomassariella vexata]ORY64479.1 amino acid permease-domain-containing protein [Pseudomassariella vexata]
MAIWRRPFSTSHSTSTVFEQEEGEISDGSIKYVFEKGGNDAPATCQEATGAPVENNSPLGYSVGPITIIFLNISKMVGTGIYSTPSAILAGTGSIGLSMIYWAIGFLTSISSGSVYLEFASYFPSRSGSEVVFLEQAYPRPLYFFPTTFAVQSVLLSFSSSNAIVLANYLFQCADTKGTDWQVKGVALAGYTVAVLAVSFHTRFSYLLSNGIGVVKVLTLAFVAITGLVVLGGHTSVADPQANFRTAWEGSPTPYGLTNALYRIIFSYAGYENAFNVVNEVKNPIKTIRKHGFIALMIVTVLYLLTNIAFFASVSKEELQSSGTIAASLFFRAVFGSSGAVRGLNFLIALSSFGNLIAVLLGSSRMIRECGRQGVLPFTSFWASTRPFGTPLGPYFVKWFLTALMILALPTGDAFNFVSDLSVYPTAAFSLAMAVGLYVVRWRRRKANLPRPQFRAWDPVVIFNILVQLYLLVMPWWPPNGGQYAGDVSFWYGTYVVSGIGILIACGVYYFVWSKALPKLRCYELRQEVLNLGNGAQSHKIVKVPVDDVVEWDSTHDAVGRPLDRGVTNSPHDEEKAARASSEN